MKTRSLLIAAGVLTTVAGVGFLCWYVYGDKEQKDTGEDLPGKKQAKAAHNNYSRAVKKPPIRATRPPEQQRSQPKTCKAKARATSLPKTGTAFPPAQPVPPPQGDEFPLRLGSRGKRVERLQVWLMRNYGWTGKITDVFDKKTQKLLKRFLNKTALDQATYNKRKMGNPVHLQPVIQ